MNENQIKLVATVVLMFCIGSAVGNAENKMQELDKVYQDYLEAVDKKYYWSAISHAQEALELSKGVFGEQSKETAILTLNIGNLYLQLNEFDEAEQPLTEALTLFESIHGKKSPEIVPVLTSLAKARTRLFKSKSPLRLLKRARDIKSEELSAESAEFGQFLVEIGQIPLSGGRGREAREFLVDGYKILATQLGDDAFWTRYAAHQLGRLEMLKENLNQAQDYFLLVVDDFSPAHEQAVHLALAAHAFLVEIYEKTGKSDMATKHAMAIGEIQPVDPNREYLPLYKAVPNYPKEALRKRIEGKVLVKFTVDETGSVVDARVFVTSGSPLLDEEAVRTVEKFRYAPKFINGQPVRSEEVTQAIGFTIRSKP